MTKPTVCMVGGHGCMRIYKEAKALLLNGYEVRLLCKQPPLGAQHFSYVTTYENHDQLRTFVRSMSGVDIFHVHNEPNELVPVVKEVAEDRPVIYDIHDLECLFYGGEVQKGEQEAFYAADGIIHISEAAQTISRSIPGSDKPNIVLYTFVNAESVPDSLPESSNFESIVYEGGLGLKDEVATDRPGIRSVNYRNYLSVVEKFVQQGYLFTLFPANEIVVDDYIYAGATVVQPILFPLLLRALRVHGLGLVGTPYDLPLFHISMPNKLFEYMSQGVVPVVINSNEVARFVRSYDCGIVLNGYEDLKGQLKDAPTKRKNVLALRKKLTMENQIIKLTKLYEEVLDQKQGLPVAPMMNRDGLRISQTSTQT